MQATQIWRRKEGKEDGMLLGSVVLIVGCMVGLLILVLQSEVSADEWDGE